MTESSTLHKCISPSSPSAPRITPDRSLMNFIRCQASALMEAGLAIHVNIIKWKVVGSSISSSTPDRASVKLQISNSSRPHFYLHQFT
mmetsp:Transcript_32317/g.52210  ORF Transcript_32317/g.52210 Transcript_32317/m.52210 type:complete len:88 (-) Transcript_32317:2331-2594(-)